jgi:GNAT superfamily N-acetyltransferase
VSHADGAGEQHDDADADGDQLGGRDRQRDPDPHPLIAAARSVSIAVRPLRESDLAEADRIFRVAFGTFLGLPDPARFAGDADWIATSWRRDPGAAFAAEHAGRLAGSNFASRWGSVGFFGPLTVRPDLWDRGIAHRLLEPVMERFAGWDIRHAGLFTFAESAKHVALYQRFGFYPRFLTAIMAKLARATAAAPGATSLCALPPDEQAAQLSACRDLTHRVFDGLDVGREITAVATHHLGDTVLVREGSRLVGLAVCHLGAGTQAGSGTCYVKFAAARPGVGAGRCFERLLDAVDAYAAARGAVVLAGVNLGREDAYARMRARGFRTAIQGVAMHRPNEPGYSRPDVYVLDDWR